MEKIILKYLIVFTILHVNFVVFAQFQTVKNYNESSYFINPIFSGDYPDPSLLVDGDNYYLIHSSFEYYPGLTIWHSKDLVNWVPVASPLTTNVGSVWAPDIVKHNGKYYIYFPANSTNYVIMADSITGAWTKPVELKVSNIDPGHFTDDKGNRFLYFNSGNYASLSADGLKTDGNLIHSYDGWKIPQVWEIECFCMEGPKVFKHGEYYYLTVAQGGTAGPATGHMVISARSKSPFGPWENSPYNPIIRATTSQDYWCSVGHATVFETPLQELWMVLHAYKNGSYTMGRQTLLAPLVWTEDDWFTCKDSFDIEKPIKKPSSNFTQNTSNQHIVFTENALKHQWKFFGDYDTARFKITENSIIIKAKGTQVSESSPLLFVLPHNSYQVEVEAEIEGNALAGLILFYNPNFFSGILADKTNIITNLRGWQFVSSENVLKSHVYLRLINTNNVVNMYYSTNGETWVKIENSLEVSGYHHNVLSGFLSLRIGLVSSGSGSVTYKNFKYSSL